MTPRKSLRSSPGLQATTDQRTSLLGSLFDGDMDGLAAALRARGDAPFALWCWPLPVFHAAVIGAAPLAALKLLQEFGADMALAAATPMRYGEIRGSIHTEQLSPLQHSLLAAVARQQTALELAASPGSAASLEALLAAGAAAELDSCNQAQRRYATAAVAPYHDAAARSLPAAAAASTASLDVLLKHRCVSFDSCVAAVGVVYWQRRGCSAAGSQHLARWLRHRRQQQNTRLSASAAKALLWAAAWEGDAALLSWSAGQLHGYGLRMAARDLLTAAVADKSLTMLRAIKHHVLVGGSGCAAQQLKAELLPCMERAAQLCFNDGHADALQLLLDAGLQVTPELVNAAALGSVQALRVLLAAGQHGPVRQGFPLVLSVSHPHNCWVEKSSTTQNGIPTPACPIWKVMHKATHDMDTRALEALAVLVAAGYRPAVYSQVTLVHYDTTGAPQETRLAPFVPARQFPGIDVEGKHRVLWLAATAEPWAPQQHHCFPPAFQAAARALLLAAEQHSKLVRLSGAAQRRQRRVPTSRCRAAALAVLPQSLLHHILGLAAFPLHEWAT